MIQHKRVYKDEQLADRASRPGDRHATRESQDWFSPQEQAAVAGTEHSIDSLHRKIFSDPAARRRILEYLLD